MKLILIKKVTCVILISIFVFAAGYVPAYAETANNAGSNVYYAIAEKLQIYYPKFYQYLKTICGDEMQRPDKPIATATAAPANTPKPTKLPQITETPVVTPNPTATPENNVVPERTIVPSITMAPMPTQPVETAVPQKDVVEEMLGLINQARSQQGLPAVTLDAELSAEALAHSKDMAQNNFFSHTSPTRGSFSQRLRASGISYTWAGENIALYGSVAAAHNALMNSEGHRANVLNRAANRVGIGIVWNSAGSGYYITQWFAAR